MAIGGLMDTNVPSQLDEDDLRAELEIEIPDSGGDPMLYAVDSDVEIEISTEDDGGVTVDFDPEDMRGEGGDFTLTWRRRCRTANLVALAVT